MRIDIIRRVDIAEPIQPAPLQDTLFYGDEYAHRIIAEVWKDGAKVDLTGAGVQGYVVRSSRFSRCSRTGACRRISTTRHTR